MISWEKNGKSSSQFDKHLVKIMQRRARARGDGAEDKKYTYILRKSDCLAYSIH
jgi:hypothetical protein